MILRYELEKKSVLYVLTSKKGFLVKNQEIPTQDLFQIEFLKKEKILQLILSKNFLKSKDIKQSWTFLKVRSFW